MFYNPFPYQSHATEHILDNDGAGLMLEMGLGKTVAALTAVDQLIKAGEVRKVLVIAPLKVCQSVWPQEVEKWDHLKCLKVSQVIGSEKNRRNSLIINANIYILNRENVTWLVDYLKSKFDFDMVIIDESSSFKNPRSKRFRSLKRVLPKVTRTIILTGTPTPQSYLDLWSQVYLLDRGDRLGSTFTAYRDKYFDPGARNGNIIFDYHLKKDPPEVAAILGKDIQEKIIFDKLTDICISMKTADYLTLPPRLDRDVPIFLPEAILDQYKQFERERVLEIAEADQSILAVNATVVAGKLLQFANGAIYTDDGKSYVEIHQEKLERLAELIDVATSPVLVFYSYRHDLDRIRNFIKNVTVLKSDGDIQDWNRGKIQVMAAHPASAGHGINLQAGGNNVLWFGVPVPRSLEMYSQGIARLDRMGQVKSVINQRLICQRTLDREAFRGLDQKANMQEVFMKYIKAKIDYA